MNQTVFAQMANPVLAGHRFRKVVVSSRATFALNAELWFRRFFLVIPCSFLDLEFLCFARQIKKS